MNDLAEKLLEAISVAEKVAFDATKSPWEWHDFGTMVELAHPMRSDNGRFATPINILRCVGRAAAPGEADRAHIAAHHPEAVLRRCAADREIVEQCQGWEETFGLAQIVLINLARGYGLEVEQPVEVVELAADDPLAQRMEQDGRQSGVDTPGCDCGHPGMGRGWHSSDCAWKRSTGLEVEQ